MVSADISEDSRMTNGGKKKKKKKKKLPKSENDPDEEAWR
jgi:hypothetical protein